MHVLESLSWHCRTASPLQPGKGQVSLPRRLDLVIALLQIDAVRDIWLAAPEWKPAFEGFFTIKVCTSPLLRKPMSACSFQGADITLPFVERADAPVHMLLHLHKDAVS